MQPQAPGTVEKEAGASVKDLRSPEQTRRERCGAEEVRVPW